MTRNSPLLNVDAAPAELGESEWAEYSALENALVEGLSDSPLVSSEVPDSFIFADDFEKVLEEAAATVHGDTAESGYRNALPREFRDSSAVSFPNLVPDVASGHAAALAFAMDSDTENALNEGLFEYEGPSPDDDVPQIWSGNLLMAIAALADGFRTRLILVDIDGISFPAGAIHELAAVCDVGTVVIAIGTNNTAQACREILFAGVSDYLVKPITPIAVREAVARATESTPDTFTHGCVAGFIGTGGSGTTTLAAATALHAAEHGRYVSVLDLNRTVSSMALLLDIEPVPGLAQLFDEASRSSPDLVTVDHVRTRYSDRIAVYAYNWSPTLHAVPLIPAVDWLLTQLRRRSHLVIVDGPDDLVMQFALLAKVDKRVLVVQPTTGEAIRAARVLDLLGEDPPVVFVQNHARVFKHGVGERVLRDKGMESRPDVVVPFEPSLPAVTDRGWPQGRLPRSLRMPLTELTDQIMAPAIADKSNFSEMSRGL